MGDLKNYKFRVDTQLRTVIEIPGESDEWLNPSPYVRETTEQLNDLTEWCGNYLEPSKWTMFARIVGKEFPAPTPPLIEAFYTFAFMDEKDADEFRRDNRDKLETELERDARLLQAFSSRHKYVVSIPYAFDPPHDVSQMKELCERDCKIHDWIAEHNIQCETYPRLDGAPGTHMVLGIDRSKLISHIGFTNEDDAVLFATTWK